MSACYDLLMNFTSYNGTKSGSKSLQGRKWSSMPDLTHKSVDQVITKMRAVSSTENISELIPIVKYRAELESYRKKSMHERMIETHPYNLFFNVLETVPETYKQPNAIKFTDLLCPSLGNLKMSLHICYYADIKWLIKEYGKRGLRDHPILIIASKVSMNEQAISKHYPNVRIKLIQKNSINRPGIHNAKLSLFLYEDDSVRIVCGSVNPFYTDWNANNQAIWVSEKCPRLATPANLSIKAGDSPTLFKTNLRQFLTQYNFDVLKPFIKVVTEASFAHIRVFLVTSFPGPCNLNSPRSYIRQITRIFSKYVTIPQNEIFPWKIVMYSPCVGFLSKKLVPASRKEKNSYFHTYILRSLAKNKDGVMTYVKYGVMYPSVRDVLDNGIVYNRHITIRKTALHQPWMGVAYKNLLRARANGYGRSKAIIRAAMYYRISPGSTKLAYFLLTSANLTRSSWGHGDTSQNLSKNNISAKMFINDLNCYEAGILFIPELFGQSYFQIQNDGTVKDSKLFPMLLDPLMVGYSPEDKLWYCS